MLIINARVICSYVMSTVEHVQRTGRALASLQGLQPASLNRRTGQHLVDPLAIQIKHLKAPAGTLNLLTNLQQVTRNALQQAGHGVVASPVFLWQFPDGEPGLEFGDRHDAVYQPASVLALSGPGVRLRAGLQLAGDRFE